MECEVKKLAGYEFWEKSLRKPRFLVAPMVDQSELAWRMLSRKYGAELCYSPMYHASVFNRSSQYRKDALATCPEDRPLIIQFCSNDPDTLLEAALVAQDHCDAIDLNLGCPQTIARKGYYGAFLSDNWDLIAKLVSTCHERLSVPITCKIRIFSEVDKTVTYAKMLESSGCQLLTVHGRTKEMKGPSTGLASWKHIKAVKDAVKIPVFANGNIQYKADVTRCLAETGVDGVMIAEGSLHNPLLFTGQSPVTWEISLEYLKFVEKYPPCPPSYARGHLFKICHHALQRHTVIRTKLSDAKSLSDMKEAIIALKEACKSECWSNEHSDSTLPFPHWICQPYVRPSPPKTNASKRDDAGERTDSGNISKKKMKKLLKRGIDIDLSKLDPTEKAEKIANLLLKPPKPSYIKCVQCGNPGGVKCVFVRCKPCCKKRMKESNLDCSFHKNLKRNRGNSTPTTQNQANNNVVSNDATETA